MKLIYLPIYGGKFTYHKVNDSTMSRIYKFLVSDHLLAFWKIDYQFVGERDLSDHSPIRIKGDLDNWGPKPFKIFIVRWIIKASFILLQTSRILLLPKEFLPSF